MRCLSYVLPLMIAALMSTAALAQSASLPSGTGPGDASRGRAIANTWCSGCHLVGPAQGATAAADVPTFASIARRLPVDVDVLAAFVANPHPPMPNLSLSRQEIRDVLTYIATLK
jgi:mono/diheme cytochrome c family protein